MPQRSEAPKTAPRFRQHVLGHVGRGVLQWLLRDASTSVDSLSTTRASGPCWRRERVGTAEQASDAAKERLEKIRRGESVSGGLGKPLDLRRRTKPSTARLAGSSGRGNRPPSPWEARLTALDRPAATMMAWPCPSLPGDRNERRN